MEKPNIVCIDDQRDVLAALKRSLIGFADLCAVVDCESAAEAKELLDELDADGEPVALLICDHIMPGQTGVEFLADIALDPRFRHSKKVMLTGLATHQDTITAINTASIDRYIEKPWNDEELIAAVKVLLTEFIVKAGIDYEPFLSVLDQETLYRALRDWA
jgi:two-component system chemotaxis response regulator CheY